MPDWLAAGGAGLLAGCALLVGSAIAWFITVPAGLVAAVMAFGSGVLISALSFELVQEAMDQAGLRATALGFLAGGGLSVPILAAVAISNVPEGLSSTAGMKKSGRSPGYVLGVWGGIAVASGLSALAGYLLLDGAPPGVVAFANALAAGAILSMITDTMIPEAFEKAAVYSGLIATLGFLAAFSLHSLG